MNPRLGIALASYAAFGLLAAFTLDGKLRVLVWLVLGAMAVKTWIAAVRNQIPK